MRAHKVMNYESILQVLQESGCPFCRFMKNYQASLLQEPGSKQIHHLCNFHTWGLAATQRASAAAELFLSLLHQEPGPAIDGPCDLCILLQEEEDFRIREFTSCLRTQAGSTMAAVSRSSLHDSRNEAKARCAPRHRFHDQCHHGKLSDAAGERSHASV